MDEQPQVSELGRQYGHTLNMLRACVTHCTDEVWQKHFGPVPFWHEAYHCVFWLHNHVGDTETEWDPAPFGVRITQKLFETPVASCSIERMEEFIDRTEVYIRSVFESLTEADLGKTSKGGAAFRTLHHQLLYGLRHGQHHVGKLTAWLYAEGIDFDHWEGR